jgi:membrane-associated phospholipid phosphatase
MATQRWNLPRGASVPTGAPVPSVTVTGMRTGRTTIGRRIADSVARFDDGAAALALVTRRSSLTDRMMYTASMLGDDGRVWIAAAAVEAARSQRPGARFVHSVGWLAAESVIVNWGIKPLTSRPRPPRTEHERRLRIPSDTSFPSGHAASAATMAVILSQDSPLAPVWTALAAVIGLSRVHVGVHHGSDVVAGWLVGSVIGLAARRSTPGLRADRTERARADGHRCVRSGSAGSCLQTR